MATTQALVKQQQSTNGLETLAPVVSVHKVVQGPPPLTDELVDELLAGRGLRGWFRALRVSMVLGLLSLYLFLDTYDIRADFNRRTIHRLRERARLSSRRERLTLWSRSWIYESLDRFI